MRGCRQGCGGAAGWWQGRREAGRPGEGDRRWERLVQGQAADTWHRYQEVEAGQASCFRIHISGSFLCSSFPSSLPYLIASVIDSPKISDYHMCHWASRTPRGKQRQMALLQTACLSVLGEMSIHSSIHSLSYYLSNTYEETNTLDR